MFPDTLGQLPEGMEGVGVGNAEESTMFGCIHDLLLVPVCVEALVDGKGHHVVIP